MCNRKNWSYFSQDIIIIGDFVKNNSLRPDFCKIIANFVHTIITKKQTTMIKRISLILALVMIALAGQAQLLWKVSGNGLGRPSYIFGTHHMAPASMIDQISGMDVAIDGCDIVVGEVEKDSLMSPEVQATMAQAMIAPLDSTLDKLYTSDEYRIVEQVFNLPGLGRLLLTAIDRRDFPLMSGMIFYLALITVILYFVSDILASIADPRIRLK